MAIETPEVSESAARLLPELLGLPRSDQEYLVQQLSGVLDDADDDPELLAELERRLENFRSGKSPGVPSEEAFRRLREGRP